MSRNRISRGQTPAGMRKPSWGLTPAVSGFTLIELLIALAIFAMISAFAYRGLNVLMESRASLATESRKWRDVALFVGRVERDMQAVLDRRAKNTYGADQAPVTSVVDFGPNPVAGVS